ncbi:MAG: hypothetical protein IKA47_09100, partial [Oscillospiraceae bacterium]|nr:hypothetical protein [Oscillospiraceae bacterium]
VLHREVAADVELLTVDLESRRRNSLTAEDGIALTVLTFECLSEVFTELVGNLARKELCFGYTCNT